MTAALVPSSCVDVVQPADRRESDSPSALSGWISRFRAACAEGGSDVRCTFRVCLNVGYWVKRIGGVMGKLAEECVTTFVPLLVGPTFTKGIVG